MTTFDAMDVHPKIQRALAGQNYTTPTPIQLQTIPPAVDGQDILGCAQTGTGKTAAFAVPILDYLAKEKIVAAPNRPVALILAPTRELAIQIGDSLRNYGTHLKFGQALVYGGVRQTGQVTALRRGVEVLVATPGRLIDLMDQGHIDLRDVEIFVLDEADRMLDMGFMPALKKVLSALPKERQSLFFSATMPPKISQLASRMLFNPVSVNVTPKSTSVSQIDQSIRMVDRAEKVRSLGAILTGPGVERAIVFTRTKHGANALVRKLDRNGIKSVAIHGNKSQNARQKALEAFRQKKVTNLIATDVAARGIDIDGVTHVINYDMPVEPESYVHRIGRTGRAGAKGVAVSFCTVDERNELRAIERFIKKRIKIQNPDESFASNERTDDNSRGPKGSKPSESPKGGGKPRRKKNRRGSANNGGQSSTKSSATSAGKKRRPKGGSNAGQASQTRRVRKTGKQQPSATAT